MLIEVCADKHDSVDELLLYTHGLHTVVSSA